MHLTHVFIAGFPDGENEERYGSGAAIEFSSVPRRGPCSTADALVVRCDLEADGLVWFKENRIWTDKREVLRSIKS